MKQSLNLTFSLLSICLIALSCGKDSGSDSSGENLRAGSYRAILQTVNPGIAGNGAFGTAMIRNVDEDLEVRVYMVETHANITHRQYIYSGSQCPTSAGDLNGDSVVDGTEAQSFIGGPVLALDGDITSQDPVGSTFPRANGAGSYTYSQQGELQLIQQEVDNLGFAGRTFVVMGVRQSSVPQTLEGSEEAPAHELVPVACGTIVPIPAE